MFIYRSPLRLYRALLILLAAFSVLKSSLSLEVHECGAEILHVLLSKNNVCGVLSLRL